MFTKPKRLCDNKTTVAYVITKAHTAAWIENDIISAVIMLLVYFYSISVFFWDSAPDPALPRCVYVGGGGGGGGGGLPGRPSTFSPHFKLLPSFLYAADIMYLVKNVNGGHLKIFLKFPPNSVS